MYTVHSQEQNLKNRQADSKPVSSALTIGNFDGYHLGHRKILEQLETVAGDMGLPAYIVTFEPNPKLFFNKEFSFLQTPAQRLSSLRSSGVNGIFVIDFSKAHRLTGEEFIGQFLIKRFGMKHLVVGEDFRFGKDRTYSLDMLLRQLETQQIRCTVVKQVPYQGEPISSSRIREALRNGEVDQATRMLGREFVIEGRVVKGEGIGAVIGYPTINIDTENTLFPRGVFITSATLSGQTRGIWGITNIGNRPTVRGTKETIETHLVDFKGNLYGQAVTLAFHRKIRPEKYFESIPLLREEIARDMNALKTYLKEVPLV
jgi:riboflavin kinase/FMN adenylyltransferase